MVESAVFHPGSYIIGNTCRDKLMRSRFVKRGGIPKSRGILRNFAMFRKGIRDFEPEKRRPFSTTKVDDLEIKRTPSNFVFLKRPLVDRSVNSQQKRKTSTRWNAFEIYQFYLIILINTFSYFFLYEVVHAKFTLSFKAYFPNLLVWRWTQSSFHQKRISISVNRQAKIKQKVRSSITSLLLSHNSTSVIPEAWKPLSWNGT